MLGPKNNSVTGLDLEAGTAAATEVVANGSTEVARTAIGILAPGAFDEGEVLDGDALAADLKRLFSEHKLSKSVRLGVANQRVLARVMRLPLIEDAEELDTAVRFQAQDELPMPLDEAVFDYQVINREKDDEGNRTMDVVAVAARRDMLLALTDVMQAAGLHPIGIDLSAFAMIRALTGVDEGGEETTTLYCHLGDVTNLAVARGGSCLFTRISPFGIEGIAHKLAERREIPLDEARRQLVVVGLEGELGGGDDELEARVVREALSDGAAKLAAELRLSLEFYGAQDDASPVERLVVCGPGSTIPGLSDQLEETLDYPVDEERPRALVGLEDHDAARLTVSYGLAVEEAAG